MLSVSRSCRLLRVAARPRATVPRRLLWERPEYASSSKRKIETKPETKDPVRIQERKTLTDSTNLFELVRAVFVIMYDDGIRDKKNKN